MEPTGPQISQKSNKSDVNLLILKSQDFWVSGIGDTKFAYRQLNKPSNQSAW